MFYSKSSITFLFAEKIESSNALKMEKLNYFLALHLFFLKFKFKYFFYYKNVCPIYYYFNVGLNRNHRKGTFLNAYASIFMKSV